MLSHIIVQVLPLHVDHAVQDHGALGLAQPPLSIEFAPGAATLDTEVFHFFRGARLLAVLVHGERLEELV